MRKVLLAFAMLGMAATSSVDPAYAAGANGARNTVNALGVVVVRFKKGTSAETMQSIISAAGGEIVTDLRRIDSMTAVSSNAAFVQTLQRNAAVRSAFPDRMISIRLADPDPSAESGKDNPQLGNPGTDAVPDPWHDLSSFLGETNPEGILQWDDNRMNVRAAWARTLGDHSIRVAVLDTGVQGSHKELHANYDNQTSTNTIPCNLLTRQFGPGLGQRDCSSEDTEGHGTWVASRIAGAVNGFASNGVAPGVTIMGYKVLSTTLGGGLTSWIVDGMIDACDNDADLINMSLGGYDHPTIDADDYLLWVDAVNYCRAKGTAILASAGNEHVRVNRVSMTVGGRSLTGVGQVDSGNQGIITIVPGDTVANNDLRGLLETPAGVPGVIMVSATSNANGAPPAGYTLPAGIQKPTVGARDQLTYYSSYGPRVDIAAPGGARKLGIPRYDAGPADILYGGWGTLGALDSSGEICTDPSLASLLTFSCFKVQGAGFGWLQGTSMSSPNATGVAALTLAAHPTLKGNPDALLARLKATARKNMTNLTGPTDPANTSAAYDGTPCATGYCHITFGANLITFGDAYGAGIVDAGAATAP